MDRYKNGLLMVAVIMLVSAVFVFAGCGGRSPGHQALSPGKVVYSCPMHPAYTSDKPGDCPICGMKLVKKENDSSDETSTQGGNIPAQPKEKTPGEVCIAHKCAIKNCPMSIKAHVLPGERFVCPVCGEVIVTPNAKTAGIPGNQAPQGPALAADRKGRRILYYRNPMNPQATSPAPLKDSMGMDYVPVYEEASLPAVSSGPAVRISPQRQQMIGVKVEPVKVIALTKVVRVSGKIAYDPELAVTQEEFIQALKVQNDVKNSPLQDVIDRARMLTEAARHKLKLLGMDDGQISVLENTQRAETNLYLPVRGENVWAYIFVYEYEIGAVKIGDSVDIEAVAYPGEKFTGKVVSINPVLDPITRTNQVRVEVPNPNNKLKPEMFISALIKESLGPRLAVPATAVLDTGLRKIVYLSEKDNVLESREVTLGQKAENYYEVLSGLKEGDAVVTSGNFLVDSESKLRP